MTPSISPSVIHSHDWVRFQSPDASPCWASIHRLLSEIPQTDRPDLARILKSGQQVIVQDTEISMQWQPMTYQDQQRLSQLLTFEQGGFYLSTFEQDMALFYHPLHGSAEYYSMNEMSERGLVPLPTITVDPLNHSVTTFAGDLLDVFVPVSRAVINFIYPLPTTRPNG